MAYHYKIERQGRDPVTDLILVTEIGRYETEDEAYDLADKLNDALPSPATCFYFVHTCRDPFETLEDVDDLFGNLR